MSVAQIIAPIIAGFLIEGQLLAAWAFAGGIFSAAGWAFIAIL
jgi:hypothetical protein